MARDVARDVKGCICRLYGTSTIYVVYMAFSHEVHTKKWRDDWLSEITKTREIDHEFRKRIENDKVFTCEKHFDVEDFEICKYGCDRSLQ